MNKRILIGIIAAAVIIGGYLWLSQERPQKYTGLPEKITLAVSEYLVSTLVYLAEDRGYFEKNGLEVTVKNYKSGKAACDALIAGEADISTSADFVFVSNSFKHRDLRAFGTVATAQAKELVARKDKGITTIKDLIGKKIGVTKKSGAEFLLGVFLALNAITYEDIEIVYLTPPEIPKAILNGAIDLPGTLIFII
jgi:NitT/TauT family transport system substrate-binding protein